MESMLRVALIAVLVAVLATPIAGAQVTTPALGDPDVSVAAGATISTAVAEAVARAEEAIVPPRLFPERGVARRGANLAYRLLKFLYFDLPQEQWLLVANHEVFGHGGRLRERFDGSIAYHIDAPVPYGAGGGATEFEFEREPSAAELLAVTTGGMEASGVAADLIATSAFANGRMNVREAMRYLGFELDPIAYVLGTSDRGEDPGHDIFEFLQTYNQMAETAGVPPLTARSLRGQATLGFANPMLAVALFGIGHYVWNGTNDVHVPAIPIGSVRYLPIVRYRLTPFGTEWELSNQLGDRGSSIGIDVRVGRAPGVTPWGLSAAARDVAAWRTWGIGLAAHVWRQPELLEASAKALVGRPRMGIAVIGRAERPLIPLWFGARRATVIVDAGVKSGGFLPGEPLAAGVIIRAGVGLPLRW